MNVFAKLRISNALDSGEPLPPSLRRQVARSPELQTLARATANVNHSLRAQVLDSATPPGLHGSIMRALHSEVDNARVRPMFAPRFALAACLLVISLGVWSLLNRPASKPPGAFATATAVLDLRNQIDHAIPDVEVSPLSEELERLNRDLDNATQTLLAALP